MFVQGAAPNFLARGRGVRVGRRWQPLHRLHHGPRAGHPRPRISERERSGARQMELGASFSLPHTIEVEVAELLLSFVPWAQMVRFGKNGSDATAGAVRLARAFTGRDVIA